MLAMMKKSFHTAESGAMIALMRFNEEAEISWTHAEPLPASKTQVGKWVKQFLRNDSTPVRTNPPQNRSVIITCEEDELTMMVTPCPYDAAAWYGLVAPVTYADMRVLDSLIPALHQVSDALVHNQPPHFEKLYIFWQGMCNHAAVLQVENRLRPYNSATYLTNAIANLVHELASTTPRLSTPQLKSEHSPRVHMTTSLLYIQTALFQKSVEAFQHAAVNAWNAGMLSWCIFCPKLHVAYAHGDDARDLKRMSQALAWYFSHFIERPDVSCRDGFIELSPGNTVRFAFTYEGWSLFAVVNTVLTEQRVTSGRLSLQDAAHDLLTITSNRPSSS